MDFEFELYEKILNLFDDCQSRGKSLEINIEKDLLQILPLPRKIILDLLLNQSISTFFRLSNDQNTLYFLNNLRLCPIDQNRGGSCQSSSCEELHICENYLLNNNCSELKISGKCSHSHSLSTHHNENILEKYHLSSKNEQTFQLIARLIKLSSSSSSSPKLIVQSINGETISNRLIDQWLDQHGSLLKSKKLINANTIELTFDDDEVASMMKDYLIQHHSKTAIVKKNLSSELIEPEPENDIHLSNGHANHSSLNKTFIERPTLGRGRGRQPVNNVPFLNNQSTPGTFSRRLSSNLSTNEKKITFSHRLHSTQNKTKSTDNLTSEATNNNPNHTNSESPDLFSSYFLPKAQEKQTPSPLSPKKRSPTPTFINYTYNKPFSDEHVRYLLGPGKRYLNENDQSEILSYLPSGYCRVKTTEQGKEIEKQLYSLLPNSLNIDLLKIDNDLALIVCSAAAEDIFQQSQIHYAIASEPTRIQLNIEVIHAPSRECQRSSSIVRENSFVDDKFHITTTDSSINVISGDISQTPVDMMICISTSNNLRESILRRAGPSIESQYKERHPLKDALLLDGGLTAARKILFVPWQTEIEETETLQTQKSLSDLVKWCIEQAHQRNMKSISFPPLGTGQLGLDPAFVCEAMISAASERLHQCKLDVLFVIYPTSGISVEEEDECYQVFRIYLDSLCEQTKSKKIPTPTMNNERQISKNSDMKKESTKRDIQSKRILILSDSSNVMKDHKSLIKSLEDLIYEKTFDLSLIESSFIDQDLLIDICLKYHVYPRIDYSREELILRGDYHSCFQCFSNLRQGKKAYQYSYVMMQDGEETDEEMLNPYISLKIDEAFAVGESHICVKDNDQRILNIDLKQLQVRLNKDTQSNFLVKKQLNDGKIGFPSSWSSSLLMIHTVEIKNSSIQSLACVQAFEKTMSISDWQIERIDSIENSPLYLHFINKNRNKKTDLYFHGCSYSSVQSIIHYGLHSTNTSICLTRDVLNSHLYGSRRSTDGKHYLFAVQLAKTDRNNDMISLSNDDACLALPTYLIVYQRRKNFH